MVKQITREEFWEIYQSLNKDLKEALFSEKTAEAVSNISQYFQVSESEISLLSKLTGRVLLGLITPDDFPQAIKEEFGWNDQKSKTIANKISEQVFLPVADSLRELHGIGITKIPVIEEPKQPKTRNPTPDLPDKNRSNLPKPETASKPLEPGQAEPIINARPDPYHEPITENDLQNLPEKAPKALAGAKIDGNIIDLRKLNL